MSKFSRPAKTDNASYVLCTSPHATFLLTTVDQAVRLRTTPEIQDSRPFRTIDLMTGERQRIDMQFINSQGNMADCLHRIRMKKDSLLLQPGTDLRNRFNGTHFVIRGHDTDQDRILTDRILHRFRQDTSINIHWQIGHVKTCLFQIMAGIQDSRMLNLCCYNMITPTSSSQSKGHPFQDPVIALTATTGKKYLRRVSLQ